MRNFPLPQKFQTFPVVAALPRGGDPTGNSGLVVVVDRGEEFKRPYVVYTARPTSTGEWEFQNGDHDLTWGQAIARVTYRAEVMTTIGRYIMDETEF